MKRIKFEKKHLRYEPEHNWQTPLVLNAYCYGGLAVAKRHGYWYLYVEATGKCVSIRHPIRYLKNAKDAAVELAALPGIDWTVDNPLLAGIDGYPVAVQTANNVDWGQTNVRVEVIKDILRRHTPCL